MAATQRKVLFLALAGIAILATLLILIPGGSAQEGGSTVSEPPGDIEQVLEDLPHLQDAIDAGETVDIFLPDPPDPTARPHNHGPFRIIPNGFVGTLPTTTIDSLPAHRGIDTADIDVLRSEPLWRDAPLPTDYVLIKANTYGVQWSNVSYQAYYRSTARGAEIRYARRRVVELPLDVGFNYEGVFQLDELRLSDGRFAIAIYGANYRIVSAYDPSTKTVTAVEGVSGVTLDQLIEILEADSVEG